MTVREALKVVLIDESLGDKVYDVRERALADPSYRGNSWDHPRVKNFSAAVMVLKKWYDEGGGTTT